MFWFLSDKNCLLCKDKTKYVKFFSINHIFGLLGLSSNKDTDADVMLGFNCGMTFSLCTVYKKKRIIYKQNWI